MLCLYLKFENSEISAVLHLIVPNIDPHRNFPGSASFSEYTVFCWLIYDVTLEFHTAYKSIDVRRTISKRLYYFNFEIHSLQLHLSTPKYDRDVQFLLNSSVIWTQTTSTTEMWRVAQTSSITHTACLSELHLQ